MTIEQMRNAIAEVYSGWAWKTAVARMHDDQVIAVYHSFQERDMFNKPSAVRTHDGRRVKQLSIFDILKEVK